MTTIQNELSWTMERLSWEDFQMLCYFYLEDIGYSVSSGRIPGPDYGCDIYGSGPRGKFVAHATSQNSKLKQKCRADVVGGARARQRSPDAPLPSEIVFVSRKRVFADPNQEAEYTEKILLPALQEAEPKYTEVRPIIRFVPGDQIVRELLCLDPSKGTRFLRQRLKVALMELTNEPEELPIAEEEYAEASCTEDDFIDLLRKYGSAPSTAVRTELLCEIAANAWTTVAFNPWFGRRLLQELHAMDVALARMLTPLCLICLSEDVSREQAMELLGVVDSPEFSAELRFAVDVFAARFLRQMLYLCPEILSDTDVVARLISMRNKSEMFWGLFFADLHYRAICRYVALPSKFSELVAAQAGCFFRQNPNSPITALLEYIKEPIVIARTTAKEAFVSSLCDMAKTCRYPIECRWVLSAFLRILPLYARTSDDLENVDSINVLIGAFDDVPKNRSPFVQFAYLGQLLRGFLRTKDIDLLMEFEREFGARIGRLVAPQIFTLQMEYASALYVALQFLTADDLRQTRFGHLVDASAELLESALFANKLLGFKKSLRRQLSFSDVGSLFGWLADYSGSLVRLYASEKIARNPMVAVELRATAMVYQNRTVLAGALREGLNALLQWETSNELAARVTRTFSLLSKREDWSLMSDVLEKAINADKYYVLRSARAIGELIYTKYWYRSEGSRDYSRSLLETFADTADVDRQGDPRFHWVYVAGITCAWDALEARTLLELGNILLRVTRKVDQLTLRRGEEVAAVFPDKAVALLKERAHDGALFAQVLLADLTTPETWNVMGTTVLNLRGKTDVEVLKMAGRFYSLAKCFARNRRQYAQKYCYNFIKCNSLAEMANEEGPNEFFLKDTLYYLQRPEAQMFAYKRDCTDPFFELVRRHWMDWNADTRKNVAEASRRITWAQWDWLSTLNAQ